MVKNRRYKLFSDVQRADDIEVIPPGKAGEKHFEYVDAVKLVNPKITVEGYAVNGRGFSDYILHADDIVLVKQEHAAAPSSGQPAQPHRDSQPDKKA